MKPPAHTPDEDPLISRLSCSKDSAASNAQDGLQGSKQPGLVEESSGGGDHALGQKLLSQETVTSGASADAVMSRLRIMHGTSAGVNGEARGR